MSKKYRNPTICEMQTQGFKFQYLQIHTYRLLMIDFSKEVPVDHSTPWKTDKKWISNYVWWHCDPFEFITETYEDGVTITVTGRTRNFFKPWSDETIQNMLDKGELRCKI